MFKVSVEVSPERVSDLLCCAFEGGSNYWVSWVHITEACADASKEWAHEQPANGGLLTIRHERADGSDGRQESTLGIDEVRRGLDVMQAKYPRHWNAFMSEDEDAETGDVFLQCCILGEVIFG